MNFRISRRVLVVQTSANGDFIRMFMSLTVHHFHNNLKLLTLCCGCFVFVFFLLNNQLINQNRNLKTSALQHMLRFTPPT